MAGASSVTAGRFGTFVFGGEALHEPVPTADVVWVQSSGETVAFQRVVPPSPDAPWPSARSWHGACTVPAEDVGGAAGDVAMVVIGGCDAGGAALSDVWVFTPSSRSWATLAVSA